MMTIPDKLNGPDEQFSCTVRPCYNVPCYNADSVITRSIMAPEIVAASLFTHL